MDAVARHRPADADSGAFGGRHAGFADAAVTSAVSVRPSVADGGDNPTREAPRGNRNHTPAQPSDGPGIRTRLVDQHGKRGFRRFAICPVNSARRAESGLGWGTKSATTKAGQ